MTDADSKKDIKNYHFTVSYSTDDELYCARVKEFPAVVSLAESAEEAIGSVRSVLAEIVEGRIGKRLSLPKPEIEDREFSGRLNLRVTKKLHRALSGAADREGVSLNLYCATTLQEHHTLSEISKMISSQSAQYFSSIGWDDGQSQLLQPTFYTAPRYKQPPFEVSAKANN